MMVLWGSLVSMALIASLWLWQKPLTKINGVLLVIFPLTALGLYWHWGNSQAWENYRQLQISSKTLPDVPHIMQALQQHLAQHPNSAQGWYLLGRLYASQQHFQDAANAFEKANALKPQQPDTLFNYAQALFMLQQAKKRPQLLALLQQLHQLAPQRDDATNLLAVALYQEGKYPQAIALWEKLSERYPADTSEGKALLKAIAMAQEKVRKNNA